MDKIIHLETYKSIDVAPCAVQLLPRYISIVPKRDHVVVNRVSSYRPISQPAVEHNLIFLPW